ncbi:MAG: multidrug ABC transporter ATP-binding protein [Thermoproteota archaeon]|nr:MAG: multidrug ABC transporter ATP-binding protein [Candidatus Korarchaeota archaeon]
MLAVAVRDLVKRYGRVEALRGLSFSVEEGEVYGLIGPNGAGKTTTLRIIATLLRPDSGRVEVFGLDALERPLEVRRIISYLPEEAGAYRNLTGEEYLRFMAGFYAEDEGELEEMVERGAEISGLGDRLRDKTKTYSKGMKRRLALARALMVRPRLAILDEPTSGLDVVHAHHVRRVIREFAEEEGVTIIVSSHNMLEVQQLCDRVGLIHRGRLVEEGAPEELLGKYGASNLEDVFVEVVRVGAAE